MGNQPSSSTELEVTDQSSSPSSSFPERASVPSDKSCSAQLSSVQQQHSHQQALAQEHPQLLATSSASQPPFFEQQLHKEHIQEEGQSKGPLNSQDARDSQANKQQQEGYMNNETTATPKTILKRSISIREQLQEDTPGAFPEPREQQEKSYYLPRIDSQQSHDGIRIPSYNNSQVLHDAARCNNDSNSSLSNRTTAQSLKPQRFPGSRCANNVSGSMKRHNSKGRLHDTTISPQYGYYINLTPPSPQMYCSTTSVGSQDPMTMMEMLRIDEQDDHQKSDHPPQQRLATVPSSTEVSYSETETSSSSSSSSCGEGASSTLPTTNTDCSRPVPQSVPQHQPNGSSTQYFPPMTAKFPAASTSKTIPRPSLTSAPRGVPSVNPVFQGLLLQHKLNRDVAIQSSGHGGPASPRQSIRNRPPQKQEHGANSSGTTDQNSFGYTRISHPQNCAIRSSVTTGANSTAAKTYHQHFPAAPI